MQDYDWNRRGKNAARTVAVSMDTKKAAKTALFLPGCDCLCVKEALRQGTIDEDTYIIAVEKDPDTAELIEEQLGELVNDWHLHVGDVTTLNLNSVVGTHDDISFAFFDFCGQLHGRLAGWLATQYDVFADDACLAFTFSMNVRKNLFLQQAQYELIGDYSGIHRRVRRQLHRRARFLHGGTNQFRDATIHAAYATLASFCEVKIEDCDEYCDTSPMLMIRFRVTQNNNIHKPNQYWRFICNAGLVMPKVKSDSFEIVPNTMNEELPAWKRLGCPANMTPGKKAAVTRRAKNGERPEWMKPAVWAWHPLNPNGIRANKAA